MPRSECFVGPQTISLASRTLWSSTAAHLPMFPLGEREACPMCSRSEETALLPDCFGLLTGSFGRTDPHRLAAYSSSTSSRMQWAFSRAGVSLAHSLVFLVVAFLPMRTIQRLASSFLGIDFCRFYRGPCFAQARFFPAGERLWR